MLENQNAEKHIQKNENKRILLQLRLEELDKEIDFFLKELNLTPEKLTRFMSNQENFTPENWEELQLQTKALDEKLLRDLKNIPDPRKVKKAYAERRIDPRWLLVK